MTKYQREGDWLVEVATMEKPDTWDYCEEQDSGFDEARYNRHMANYKAHLSSLKRLRISPELAAHLGDRMEVGESEIEVRTKCLGTNGAKSKDCNSEQNCKRCTQTAFPKLIDGEEDKRITLSFNLLRNAPNSFMIEPVGMEIKGKFNLTYLNEFFEWEQNLEEIGRGMKEGEWRRFTVELFEDGDDDGYFYSHKSTTSSKI